ncbi:hypothetical protein TWF718_005178 [Orbilia javanica]|uniref:C2H2-type domain-containing protein n=1 Tax=Orbilia javanica TaxID=47235 RepID=A0AAN8RLK7_9PEZI
MNVVSDIWAFGAPLEPHPKRPHATSPAGYHPVQFCTGFWNNYCPDPYHCPFGAIWVRKDHFDLIHGRESTSRAILTNQEVQRGSVPFKYFLWEVPERTCILSQYAEGLEETGPHYPRPYEAHHLAPYRRYLQNKVPRKVFVPAAEPRRGSGSPSTPGTLSSSSGSSSSSGESVQPGPRPVPFRDITASQINVVTISSSGKPEKKRASLIPGSVLAVELLPDNAAAAEREAPSQAVPSDLSKRESPPPTQQPTTWTTDQPAQQPNKHFVQGPACTSAPTTEPIALAPVSPAASPVADLPDLMTCKWGTCSRVFTDQRVALEHIKSDHIKSRKYADYDFTCRIRGCPCGGKVFEKRDNVVSHVTNVAFDIRYAVCCFKPYGCTVALKREWDLPRHRKICKFRPEGYVTETEEGCGEGVGKKRKRGKEGGREAKIVRV